MAISRGYYARDSEEECVICVFKESQLWFDTEQRKFVHSVLPATKYRAIYSRRPSIDA